MVDLKKYQGVKTSMKKNRIRPIKAGNGIRMSYARQEEVLEMPNLITLSSNTIITYLSGTCKNKFEI